MSNKVGRPTVPKDKAKSVLLGAQLSPTEAQNAANEAARVGRDKSKWMRDTINREVHQKPPPPHFFKSATITIDQLHEMSGKSIEFTLRGNGRKIHGFGKLFTRQSGDGEISIDIDVIEEGVHQFTVTRFWLLPPNDAKIIKHPDPTKAEYLLPE